MHTHTCTWGKKVGKASSVWLSGSKEILHYFIHSFTLSLREQLSQHALHKFLFLSNGNRVRRKFSYFQLYTFIEKATSQTEFRYASVYNQIGYGNESRKNINEFMIIIIRFASNHYENKMETCAQYLLLHLCTAIYHQFVHTCKHVNSQQLLELWL